MVKLKYTGNLEELYADGVKFTKGEVKHVSDAAASAILKAFPNNFVDDDLKVILEEVIKATEEVVVEETTIEKTKLNHKEPRHGIFK